MLSPCLFFRRGGGWSVQWSCTSVSACCVSFVTCRQSHTGRYVCFWIQLRLLCCSASDATASSPVFGFFTFRLWCIRPRCWSCSWWRTVSKWMWASTSSSTARPSPSWSGTRSPWPPPPRRTSLPSTSARPETGPTNLLTSCRISRRAHRDPSEC